MRRFLALLAILSAAGAAPASAQVLGWAAAVDADAVSISGARFKIAGIDAVELHQYCYIDGQPWTCGVAAVRALEVLTGAQPTRCTPVGDIGPDGIPARCDVGGADIGEAMVEDGFAVALAGNGDAYLDEQEAARAAGRGIWRAVFQLPADYRAGVAAAEAALIAEARQSLAEAASAALVSGDGGIEMFDSFTINTGGTNGRVRALPMEELRVGFVNASIGGDLFDWREPAAEVADWRRIAERAIVGDAVNQVIGALLNMASRTVRTTDAETYFQAIVNEAGRIASTGRKPVLIVDDAANPRWLLDWFGGDPLSGMEISGNDRPASVRYLGVINGIEIYMGSPSETQSLMVPADLLASVTYASAPAEPAVTASDATPLSSGTRVTMTYIQDLTWREGEVVVIQHPFIVLADDIGG